MKRILILLLLISSFAWSDPYQIVIFRHGEKIQTHGFIDDLNAKLNAQGQQRAAYLVKFLLHSEIIDQKKHPIGAMYVPKSYVKQLESEYNYVRCIQTILPLYHEASTYLKREKKKELFFNEDFLYTDAPLVLADVLKRHFDGETVVICWEHENIPLLFSTHFKELKPSFPEKDIDRYDMVWVVRFADGKAELLTFKQITNNGFNIPVTKDLTDAPSTP